MDHNATNDQQVMGNDYKGMIYADQKTRIICT